MLDRGHCLLPPSLFVEPRFGNYWKQSLLVETGFIMWPSEIAFHTLVLPYAPLFHWWQSPTNSSIPQTLLTEMGLEVFHFLASSMNTVTRLQAPGHSWTLGWSVQSETYWFDRSSFHAICNTTALLLPALTGRGRNDASTVTLSNRLSQRPSVTQSIKSINVDLIHYKK